MGELLSPWHLIVLMFVGVMISIAIVPLWMIAKRAGLNPAISLLTVVPFIGLIVMYYIAFAKWPNVPSES
jgi:hypothetical protein